MHGQCQASLKSCLPLPFKWGCHHSQVHVGSNSLNCSFYRVPASLACLFSRFIISSLQTSQINTLCSISVIMLYLEFLFHSSLQLKP